MGGPLAIVQIDETGVVHTTKLGPDINAGHVLQPVVAANRWFGAAPETEFDYCFVGCTVAPGFDFLDFKMGNPAKIRAEFPKVTQKIERVMLENFGFAISRRV